MRKQIVLAFSLAIVLLMTLAVPVLAQSDGPGQIVLGGEYTLQSGQILRGDLGVLGGNAIIEKNATVFGDVIVAGGNLDVAGRIDGDIAVFGGNVTLEESATVDGDVVSFGGNVRREGGAVVEGDVTEDYAPEFPGFRGLPIFPGNLDDFQPMLPRTSPGQVIFGAFLGFLRSVILVFALSGLALLVALIWPRGVERIGRAGLAQPAMSLVVGILTWVVGAVAMVLMAVTICLIPVALLTGLLLLAAAIMAWIASGWVVGSKLLAVFKVSTPSVVLQATIGTMVLAIVYFLVSSIPCVDFIFGTLIASFGMGAIVLTRFGTRPYPVEAVVTPVQSPAVVEEDDIKLIEE
ncbi:MAG: polymer-forming cytoskeletal protein [Chloroflexota bacterium]|nr:polymer-forming cytoskeletal protein [Chloroflexota bacterium]